jgi:hypothetical protein
MFVFCLYFHRSSSGPVTSGREFSKIAEQTLLCGNCLTSWAAKSCSDSPFVLSRRKAGFDCPYIWHLPNPVWQLPERLLADNLLHKQLVDTGVKTLPK